MLEMDLKGNLYFYKTALLCKNDIIKRLINGKYHLEQEIPIGNSSVHGTIEILEHLHNITEKSYHYKK